MIRITTRFQARFLLACMYLMIFATAVFAGINLSALRRAIRAGRSGEEAIVARGAAKALNVKERAILAARAASLAVHMNRESRLYQIAESLKWRGFNDEAARRLEELSVLEKVKGGKHSESVAKSLEDEAYGVRASGNSNNPVAIPDLSVGRVIEQLTRDDALLLRDLQIQDRRVGRIILAQANVKQFSKDFLEGAKNPWRYLDDRRLIDQDIAALWKQTPPEKRIFIIGAGEDAEAIQRFQSAHEESGYLSLFYKDCRLPNGSLCDSKTVGAFVATASRVMYLDSAAAGRSLYIPVEVASALRANGMGKAFIILSPEQVLTQLRGKVPGAGMIVVGLMSVPDAALEAYDWGLNFRSVGSLTLAELSAVILLGVRIRRRRSAMNCSQIDMLNAGSHFAEFRSAVPVGTLILLAGVCFGTGAAVVATYFGSYDARPWIPLGLIGTVFFGLLTSGKACTIRINEMGFQVRHWFRSKPIVPWSAAGTFQVEVDEHRQVVVFEPPRPAATSKAGRVWQHLFSNRKRLPPLCGVQPDRFAAIMNEFRATAATRLATPA